RGLRRAGHGELRLDLERMVLYAVADCLPRPSAHARPYADAALGPLLTQNLCDRVAAPHAVEDPERISHVRLAARIGADQQRERIQREGRVLEALEIQQAEAGEHGRPSRISSARGSGAGYGECRWPRCCGGMLTRRTARTGSSSGCSR